jgi:hypothetical protein
MVSAGGAGRRACLAAWTRANAARLSRAIRGPFSTALNSCKPPAPQTPDLNTPKPRNPRKPELPRPPNPTNPGPGSPDVRPHLKGRGRVLIRDPPVGGVHRGPRLLRCVPAPRRRPEPPSRRGPSPLGRPSAPAHRLWRSPPLPPRARAGAARGAGCRRGTLLCWRHPFGVPWFDR